MAIELQTLVCAGTSTEAEHSWEREVVLGGRPKWCPEHGDEGRREAAIEAGRKWRAENPEKAKENRASWFAANPDYEKERRTRSKEGSREYQAAYYLKNRDRRLAARASYYAKKREHRFLTSALRDAEDQNKKVESPNKAAEAVGRRRARKLGSRVLDSGISWVTLLDKDGPECWLCGENVDPEDYTVGTRGRGVGRVPGPRYPSHDHVIPLSAGGDHSWANSRLAHLQCNKKKHTKIIE